MWSRDFGGCRGTYMFLALTTLVPPGLSLTWDLLGQFYGTSTAHTPHSLISIPRWNCVQLVQLGGGGVILLHSVRLFLLGANHFDPGRSRIQSDFLSVSNPTLAKI